MQERNALEDGLGAIGRIERELDDQLTLIELGEAENDSTVITEAEAALKKVQAEAARRELEALLSGEADINDAFLEVQAGAGGTEAQDWAEMLLRMYLRWAESRGWKTELMEVSGGDVAGIKSATFRVEGEYAYGWLKTEIGVHRLVRKSPFDSDNRRHTSFTSVFVSPEVDDDIDIEINPADLRTDVYRSSGAGGQHVNKTESAVRITHLPTGIVVQSQAERSQHKNREFAMKMLKSRVYVHLQEIEKARIAGLTEPKKDIDFGSQIRSYVLQPYTMVKDTRTGAETSDVNKVLDGDLDLFIDAFLRHKE